MHPVFRDEYAQLFRVYCGDSFGILAAPIPGRNLRLHCSRAYTYRLFEQILLNVKSNFEIGQLT